jgi:(E)-2-((N-methylformamido)methylene)succinate hydrolase
MVHEDRRPAVALIHGLGLDDTMWDRCVLALSGRCDLVTVTLPGHGDSRDIAPDATLGSLAAAAARQLGPRTHLAGFSLGGLVAAQIAFDRPDLVSSLVLVSTVGRRTDAERTSVRRRYEQAQHDFGRSVEDMIRRWFRPSWSDRDPLLARDLVTVLHRSHRPTYLACFEAFVQADEYLWARVDELQCPVTVITGAEDGGATPEMAREIAARIPRGRYDVIPDAAHLLPLERPEAVVKEILDHLELFDGGQIPIPPQ